VILNKNSGEKNYIGRIDKMYRYLTGNNRSGFAHLLMQWYKPADEVPGGCEERAAVAGRFPRGGGNAIPLLRCSGGVSTEGQVTANCIVEKCY